MPDILIEADAASRWLRCLGQAAIDCYRKETCKATVPFASRVRARSPRSCFQDRESTWLVGDERLAPEHRKQARAGRPPGHEVLDVGRGLPQGNAAQDGAVQHLQSSFLFQSDAPGLPLEGTL